ERLVTHEPARILGGGTDDDAPEAVPRRDALELGQGQVDVLPRQDHVRQHTAVAAGPAVGDPAGVSAAQRRPHARAIHAPPTQSPPCHRSAGSATWLSVSSRRSVIVSPHGDGLPELVGGREFDAYLVADGGADLPVEPDAEQTRRLGQPQPHRWMVTTHDLVDE